MADLGAEIVTDSGSERRTATAEEASKVIGGIQSVTEATIKRKILHLMTCKYLGAIRSIVLHCDIRP